MKGKILDMIALAIFGAAMVFLVVFVLYAFGFMVYHDPLLILFIVGLCLFFWAGARATDWYHNRREQ